MPEPANAPNHSFHFLDGFEKKVSAQASIRTFFEVITL
jgi:hypothetical protein